MRAIFAWLDSPASDPYWIAVLVVLLLAWFRSLEGKNNADQGGK